MPGKSLMSLLSSIWGIFLASLFLKNYTSRNMWTISNLHMTSSLIFTSCFHPSSMPGRSIPAASTGPSMRYCQISMTRFITPMTNLWMACLLSATITWNSLRYSRYRQGKFMVWILPKPISTVQTFTSRLTGKMTSGRKGHAKRGRKSRSSALAFCLTATRSQSAWGCTPETNLKSLSCGTW